MSTNQLNYAHQDIGYLLTAYADSQLVPDGVMWVEEQLDRNAELRAKLKEIRSLQAGLRQAFAGNAPTYALDLPRRDALLASVALTKNKKSNIISFRTALRLVAAASIVLCVWAISIPNLLESRTQAMARTSPESRARMESLSDDAVVDKKVDQKAEILCEPTVTIFNGTSAASVPSDSLAAFDAPGATGEKSSFGNRKDLEESYKYARGSVNAGGPVGGLAPLGENKSAAPTQAPTGWTSFDGGSVYSPPLAKAERGRVNNSLADEKRNAMDVSGKLAQPSVAMVQRDGRQMEQEKEVDGLAAASPSPKKPTATSAAPVVVMPSSPPVGAVRPQSSPAEAQQLARMDSDKRQEPKQQGATNDDRLERNFAKGTQYDKADTAREEATVSLEGGAAGGGFALNAAKSDLSEKNDSSQELTRQSNNEKKHIAPITSATGFQLKAKLADDEVQTVQDELVQLRRERHVYLRQIPADGVVATEKGKENIDEKIMAAEQRLKNELPKKSYRILNLAQSIASFPGPDLDIPEPQGEKGNVKGVTQKHDAEVDVLIDIIKDMVAPDTWGKNGAALEMYNGQLVVTNSAEVQQQVEDFIATLRRQHGQKQPTDPAASLAFLQQNMTGNYKENLVIAYQIIGGSAVIYDYSASAESFKYRQTHLLMNDEPVSRGVLRIARSVNLQAQFTGGIVHLDVAQRPLDPTDSQGFELPTFRTLMGTSPMQSIVIDPVQTVAIDADTASYAYAKARIAAGEMIDASTIKPEHFINAMPMDYPKALGPEAFSLYAEAAPSPFARAHTAWGARTALVSIGAVAKPAAADERRPLALTLAIDCSGSMAQPGALDRIKVGLQTLIGNLRAEDRVSIVAFGDQARVVLPATPGNDPNTVLTALQTMTTGGATNAAEGLTLAYQLAAETAAPGVESRVLLATDGGTVAGADDLLRRVTAFKDRGITLVVVGCGQTYRAGPLQELATKGDGQHFFVGSNDEAQTLFSTTLLPDRLAVLAKDAKLQVTWNPQRISHARLIGYDQRRLATKDFRDNRIDAGELSQDTQVTALFEVLLVDGGTGPLGNAAVRYYDTRREQVRELACPLPGSILASQPSDRLRLLACAATTAEWLQRGWWSNVHLITPAEITAQLKRCPQPIAAELRKMVEQKAEHKAE